MFIIVPYVNTGDFLRFNDNFVKAVTKQTYNKAERGFGLLARAAKPPETCVVHQSGHPSQH